MYSAIIFSFNIALRFLFLFIYYIQQQQIWQFCPMVIVLMKVLFEKQLDMICTEVFRQLTFNKAFTINTL